MSHTLYQKHEKTLKGALEAISTRACWSPFPEVPSGKIYGETARGDGFAAFEARIGKAFELAQPGADRTEKTENSPFGQDLGIRYPKPDLDELFGAVHRALKPWRNAAVETRVGICLEILDRLGRNPFEMANAIMHTTGQSFMMAFQAGGPHALDRGLEAVAYAYAEMTRCPREATWEKRVGKTETVRLQKSFRIVPRGIAALLGCSTFPTWNGYPGLFASLATGNGVVVKPHDGAVLPLALAVETARTVLEENDFDPNVIALAANGIDGSPITKELVTRADVGIIDYTGGSAFGEWIETNCRHARVYAEKAGVNSVVIDSVEDLKAATGNIGFSVCLYSGQMCTSPQNIFLAKDGIRVGDDRIGFDDAAAAIVGAVNWLLSDPARAVEVLGAIQNEGTLTRLDRAVVEGGAVLRASESMAHEKFPGARVRSPAILQVDADQKALYMREVFGPIVYIIKTESSAQSVALAAEAAREHGAITSAVYSTDAELLRDAQETLTDAGVPVSCNLTGQIFVNQAAAFSDFHVSGANPAGNATLCDAAFVVDRFRIVHTRVPV